MTPPLADKQRCECGHPREAHVARGGSHLNPDTCRATIYETVQMGMNAWPCRCKGFRVKDGS